MPPPSGSSSEQVVDLDPLVIYFTFSRIRPRFSCGRTIESTVQQFRNGELQPRDLPLLAVLTDGTHYFSQNNRRLFTYKQLRREGLLEVVPVRLRPFPQTKRMQNKYTPETCALTATLMRDVGKGGDAASTKEPKAKAEEDEEEEEGEENKDEEKEGLPLKGSDARAAPPAQPPASASPITSVTSSVQHEAQQQQLQGKKVRQKDKKKQRQQQQQQQRGSVKGRGGSSDDDDSDGAGGNSLEAELRKLGLQ